MATGFDELRTIFGDRRGLCGVVGIPSCEDASADMEVFSSGEQACGVNIEGAGETFEILEMFERFITFVSSFVGVPGGEMSCTVPFTESGVK